ncbi:MAG: hypothetical protein KKB50_09680 [Planctomycetes bacterium]|nr:hypothetical protein [Planctomycetota bacterium]
MVDLVGMRRNWMWAALVMVLIVPSTALAQKTPGLVESVADGEQFEVWYAASFSTDDLVFGELLGYDTVDLIDGGFLDQPGQPLLPARLVRLALPAGMKVTGLRVVETQTAPLPGEYTLFPAQPPQRVATPPEDITFTLPDAVTYASAAPYPANAAEFSHQTDLLGQGIAVLRLFPVQYAPAAGQLSLCITMRIVVEGVGGYECGDYLSAGLSDDERARRAQRVADLVANPADVEVRPAPNQPRRLGVSPGEYDYVIITQSSWVDDFQALADWKTKKGVSATIITTDWIYNSGGYGGSNQAKIRAFVQDAYANWGAQFFLLGGDTNIIPYYTSYIGGDSIPNDTYYGDFDSDWTCEAHIGRAAVRDTAAIATFLSKVFTYEKNPPATNYADVCLMLGFDLHSYGSNEGEGCKEAIRADYCPPNWTIRTEYDSESGTHKSDSIAYLNQGNNLVNHIDHSNSTVMGVGYTNHGELLGNSDMSALYNGNRQSILYTIGCWACDYAATECIAEAFVHNTGGGGVAFVGNSRYGWYSPYQPGGYSLGYDRCFFRCLFEQGWYQLGACFSDHKNDGYVGGDTSQYIFTELTLLGDPEMPVWRANPQALTVTHDATLAAGVFTGFPVQVYCGGNPVDYAKVCLWKDGDVYETVYTGAGGWAQFWFAPSSSGTMYVTVTKFDRLPYEGTAEVVEEYYTLTVNTQGQGSVTLDPPGGSYGSGTNVELTANPSAGWCFDQWTGNLTGSDNPDTLSMNDDKTVTAMFALDCNENAVPDYQENEDANGLAGAYYDDDNFTGMLRGRIDQTINFNWGTGAPWPNFDIDNYSVRWTGYVQTPGASGTYTFYTTTDDGVRLWVDDQLIIDHWVDQSPQEWSGTITLAANSEYAIVMEYYENGGGAVAELRWEPPGMSKEIIPAANLIPERDCNENSVPDTCDIDAGTSDDVNVNGIPDECEPHYTLTINITGQGSVDLDPVGGTYLTGTDVTLTANAAGGWSFEHWEDDLTGSTNPEMTTMDADKTVTAVFVEDIVECTLTIGSTPLSGISIQVSPLDNGGSGDGLTQFQRVYDENTAVTLTAPSRPTVAGDVLTFCHWEVDGVPQADEETALLYTVSGDAPLSAVYLLIGDMNADGAVNGFDIDLFIEALDDQAGFEATYGPCRLRAADINGDGAVNGFDIDAFVVLLG